MQERIGIRAGSKDDRRDASPGQSRPAAVGEPIAIARPLAVLDLNIFETLKNRVKPMLV